MTHGHFHSTEVVARASGEDRQRLEYVADLLAELQGVVRGAGTETLRGLMVLAQHEATALAAAYGLHDGRGDA